MSQAILSGRQHGPIRGFIDSGNMRALDPFVLFDHFSLQSNDTRAGFDFHGHSGIGVVTYITGADLFHEDSAGNTRLLKRGAAQYLKAGSGALHRETLLSDEGSFEGFQLWTVLPQVHEMSEPDYQFADSEALPLVSAEGTQTRVIVGEYQGALSPLQPVQELSYFHVISTQGSLWSYRLKSEPQKAFLYVVHGALQVGADRVSTNELLILDQGEQAISVQALEQGSEFLFMAAEPLGQEMVSTGASVHSSRANAIAGTERIQTLLKQLREERQ